MYSDTNEQDCTQLESAIEDRLDVDEHSAHLTDALDEPIVTLKFVDFLF
jgi:hypothetical protein